MKGSRNTLIGSIILLFIGTSCCWLSAVIVWLGGSVVLGLLVIWIEDIQFLMITVALGLACISVYLYLKKKRRS